MTYCLSKEAVLAIHQRVAPGQVLLHAGTLEGALDRPMRGFGDVEFHPTAIEKAAVLLHGLATTQAFSDGNKRVAWACCVTYLGQNGIEIGTEVSGDEIYDFVLAIANNSHAIEDIALQLNDWTV